jgi:hypothetical protein
MPLGTINNESARSENRFGNPYQPQTESSSISDSNRVSESSGEADAISETALRYLKEATPWLRFIGVVGFVGCSFTALVGLIMLIAAPMIPEGWTNGALNTLGPLSGLFQIGVATVGFFSAHFIYSFGTRLRNYLKTNSVRELELAFKNNKSFWKFTGVLTIVGLAIIPITIVITLVVALGSSLF